MNNKLGLVKESIFGKDWDYSSLYLMEYHKICQMLKCAEKNSLLYSNSNTIIRDLRICKNLLGIMLEIDEYSIIAEHNSKNVNTRNIDRFFNNDISICHLNSTNGKYPHLKKWAKYDIYYTKARHLYHTIRFLKEQTWWF